MDLPIRPRRLRRNEALRDLVRETQISPAQLVAPLFVKEGAEKGEPIPLIPENFRLYGSSLLERCRALLSSGICHFLLFPYIKEQDKDEAGSKAGDPHLFFFEQIRLLKKEFPQAVLWADVALDPFTSHGHDGVLDSMGLVDNDKTVAILADYSCLLAEAGVDIVAPSDMMDGRVKAIRESLDRASYQNVGILSYAAKYASSFYGPFRSALESTPGKGDKKNYQMDPANAKEALLEASLDEEEGADLLLVKPATLYLDIIHRIQEQAKIPVGAYHVSGEYALLYMGAEKGFFDLDQALIESHTAILRAGARFIITYAAERIAKYLREKL